MGVVSFILICFRLNVRLCCVFVWRRVGQNGGDAGLLATDWEKKTNSRHGQLSVAEKPVGNISRTIHRVDPPRAWMVDDPPDCA